MSEKYIDLTSPFGDYGKKNVSVEGLMEKKRIIETAKEGMKRETKEERHQKNEERKKNIKENVKKILSNLPTPSGKLPSVYSTKMSYKTSNPLKGLLKTKRETVRIKPNGGDRINLMRASW